MDKAPPASSGVRAEAPAVLTAWPRSAQLATAFLLGVALTLLLVHVLDHSRMASRPTELYRIDLNRANRAELVQLPGISDQLAGRIEDHRRVHGPFRRVDDLIEVDGLGPVAVERLRPWVQVDESGSAPPPTYPRKETPTDAIDINHASAEELQRLPGIGPTLAKRIIEERQRMPFHRLEDLDRVPGIGPKTLAKLRPFVTFGSVPVSVVTVE